MENQVDEVKSKIDIVALISESVQLKKAGRNYKGLCPFHGEKTPSFMVSPDRQIFKCFGCSEGGDALAFVEKIERVSFPEALRILANRAGVVLKQIAPDPREKQKEQIFKINSLASELFGFVLAKHKNGQRALTYLKSRGINDSSIKDFGLGYAPEKDDFATGYFTKKGFSSNDLIAAGLILPSQRGRGFYDRFRARITFPIRDTQGRVVGFSARALGDNEPKYLNSPDTVVFNKGQALFGIDLAKSEISKEKLAVLVEGNLDVVSSHQVGVKNVVAPLGTALTESQLSVIKRFADSIVLAFDSDSAGIEAARRGIELAENQGLAVKIADLGSYKDPDELIKDKPKSWAEILKTATPIYDFVINTAVKRWSGQGAEGKRRAIGQSLSYLTKLKDPILRDHYLEMLAARVGSEVETVRSLLDSGGVSGKVTEQEEQQSISKAELEEYFLAILLNQEKIQTGMKVGYLQKIACRDLFTLMQEVYKKEGKLTVKAVLAKLPKAMVEQFDTILLANIDESLINNPEKLEKEIKSTYGRVKKSYYKKQLQILTLKIKQAEAGKNLAEIETLTKKFRDLSNKLSALDQDS